MLVACPTCHRQYDVGDHAPGTKIRCHCGVLCTVPEARARQITMAHCSQCGGTLEPDATTCGFCEAQVALGDRGLGETCPECFARMVRDARFCSSCGTSIGPEAVLKALTSSRCPRCEGELARCESEQLAFTECTACGGLWLEAQVFDQLAASHERDPGSFLPGRGSEDRAPLTPEQTVRYLRCPVCAQHMNRKNFGASSGVVIDWCRGHGYWFDVHELQKILDFIARGGLDKSQESRAELNRMHRETAADALRQPVGESVSGRRTTFVDLVVDFLSLLI